MFAFVFPGQGSQHIGMAQFLYDNFKSVQIAFEEASDAAHINFKQLCFEGPESELTLTQNTQPALLLASYSYFLSLKEICDIKNIGSAGHSLGEYSALVCNKNIKFSDAIALVQKRGQFMQEAVPFGKGGMLAVLNLEEELIPAFIQWMKNECDGMSLQAANYNCPGQIVFSGSKQVCDYTAQNFKAEMIQSKGRVKIIPLNVSAPFHSQMMMPAQEKMAFLLNDSQILDGQTAVVQNIDAKAHFLAEEIRKNLISQISGSVRWTECVQELRKMGAEHFIELGPGKVLSGLIKKIDANAKCHNILNLDSLKELEQAFKTI